MSDAFDMSNYVDPGEKVELIIDGWNFYSSTRSLGITVDFRKLYDLFRTSCYLNRAHYFSSYVESDDEAYSPIVKLTDWLDYNRYSVVSKPLRRITNATTGQSMVKGGCQVEMAVRMLTSAQRVDHIMLLSGDGDLTEAVRAVKEIGPKVTVIASMKSAPTVATELRRIADNFIELDVISRLFAKVDATGEQARPALREVARRPTGTGGTIGERLDPQQRSKLTMPGN